MSLRGKPNNEKQSAVDPAAVAAAANASNLRLLGAQSRYLTHLRQQMTKLRDHSGAFGSVRYDLERRKEQALQVESSLVEAEEALLGPSLNSNAPTFPVVEPQPATTPDLESLASHLESLARHIQEMESLADTQGAGLKKDLARVMEVFEDPSAFLPTPLKQPPTITSIQDSSVVPPLDTSGILRSSRGREGVRSARFSPQSSSRSITSPRTNQQQPEQEKPVSSFHRVGDTIIVAPKDLDFDEPLSISPLLPSMATGDSVVGSIIQANPDPEDSLEAFRASIARDIHSWRCGKTLAEAQEEIRRLGREATSNGQAAQKLQALTNKIDPMKKSSRRTVKSKQSEPENVPPPVNARDKKRAVKSMSNPEMYPWTAQLQEIFKGVRMDPNAPPGVIPPPAAMAFGGLAQSIPAFLEYQQYLQQQILAQEKERQAEEARKLEEEKKEAAAAAAAAIAAAKKAKKLAQHAAENANNPSQLAPVEPQLVPALALPTVQHSVAAIQTSPRFPASSAWPHSMMGAPLSADGRPSQQVFGQHIPRFDAIWEVLPSNRDASVQSEAGPPTARSIAVPSTIPSLPGSPRAPRYIIGAAAGSVAGEPYQQGHIIQSGRGQTPAGSPRAKKSALSAIDQAALDLQAQAKQRGEGLSSSKALEQLMQIAGQDNHHVPPHHSEADTSAVLPHPLFSSNPAQQLAHYPNGKLLNLVMQMYDMPSEAQVDAEWKRVLTQEEELAEKERIEREAQVGEPVEQLNVPASTVDEHKAAPSSSPRAAAKPSVQTEEKKYDSDYEAEAEQQQTQQERAVREREAAIVAQREAAELEAAKKRADELEQARLRAELEAAKLALELQRVKDESAAAIAAAQRQPAPVSSAEAVQQAPAPAVTAVPAQPQVSMDDLRALWENEARARWTAEQEKQKAEAALAAAQAQSTPATVAAPTAVTAAPVPVTAAPAQEQHHAAHHHPHHSSASSVDPAIVAELAKLRAMNAAESSILDKVRGEEQTRWEKENARRDEERTRFHRLHEEEERRFEARKKEREAEETRRRELERRRDELLQQKLDLEQQKTRAELEALRADMERLKVRAQAVPVEPAFVDRAPLSGYRPRRPLDESDSSFSTSDDLMSTGESNTGRHDLSEGEIDLGGARSPGLLVPPSSHLRIGHKKPSSYKSRPMTAAVLHPPIPSATPQRPGPGQVLRPAPEQKYPHPAEFQSARDPYDNLVRDQQRISLGSSSTRDDIADLLRQSQDLRESTEIESVLNGESAQPNVNVAQQFNVPYNAAISSVKAALAAPSRQVIVGTASPPLIDSDLSKLVRDSIDAYDSSIGASTDNIGGLFGLGTDRAPLSSRSTGSAVGGGLAGVADESLDEHDLSFNSPKMTATEQWLKSLKDQDD